MLAQIRWVWGELAPDAWLGEIPRNVKDKCLQNNPVERDGYVPPRPRRERRRGDRFVAGELFLDAVVQNIADGAGRSDTSPVSSWSRPNTSVSGFSTARYVGCHHRAGA